MPKSIIYRRNFVVNKNPHRLANEEYYLVYVQDDEGKLHPALFTQGDLQRALIRATRNPEDAPVLKPNWLQKLLEKLNLSCASLAAEQSEFEYAEIASCPSYSVQPLSVQDSLVRYECRLREILKFSTLPSGGKVALLDVQAIYVDDRVWNGTMIDQEKLNSLGKMGGDFYSLTSDLRKLSRPQI